MGRRERAENRVNWLDFGKIEGLDFWKRKFREGEYT
jgi:hypothetical protein